MAKKKNPTRRILIILGILIVGVILIGVVGKATGLFGQNNEGIEVETANTELRDVIQVVTASGRVQPEVEVAISPDVSGEIIFLGIKEGDAVQKGDLLVRIKPDFYEAQLEQASAGVSQSQAQLSRANADMMQAELELNRQKALFEKDAIAESAYETAQTQFNVSKANREAARFSVESAQAREREAREQVSKTIIYAPMSGTISQLNVEVGERVLGTVQMAGTEMMRVALLDQMELEAEVNENDVVNITLGDTASIEIDAYPDTKFRGVVTEIANSARLSGAGTQDQVTNFPVKIRVLDPHNIGKGNVPATPILQTDEVAGIEESPQFRPGMSGTVDVFTHLAAGTVAIPIQAVTIRDVNKVRADADKREAADEDSSEDEQPAEEELEEDLQKVVFIVNDGKAQMVVVETGISDDTHIEIKSGLTGDEMVIIGPYRAVSRTLRPDIAVRNRSNRPLSSVNAES